MRIEEVRTAEDLRQFKETIIRGFPFEGLDPLQAEAILGVGALQDQRLRCWIGYTGVRPVSASCVFVACGINNVTLVATLPMPEDTASVRPYLEGYLRRPRTSRPAHKQQPWPGGVTGAWAIWRSCASPCGAVPPRAKVAATSWFRSQRESGDPVRLADPCTSTATEDRVMNSMV